MWIALYETRGFLDYTNLPENAAAPKSFQSCDLKKKKKKVILPLDGQKPLGLFWLAFRLNDIWHSQLSEVTPDWEWPWVWEAWGCAWSKSEHPETQVRSPSQEIYKQDMKNESQLLHIWPVTQPQGDISDGRPRLWTWNCCLSFFPPSPNTCCHYNGTLTAVQNGPCPLMPFFFPLKALGCFWFFQMWTCG